MEELTGRSDSAGDAPQGEAAQPPTPDATPAPPSLTRDAPGVATSAPPDGGVRATPIARRLAREKGLDLARISGTGPGSRITEADVLGYEEQTKTAPPPPPSSPTPAAASGGRVELSRMRRAIARVTTQSKQEAPHFYITSEIDMSEAMAFRRQLNDALDDGTRVSVNDLVIKAAAKTLEKFPSFNASFQEDSIEFHPEINIGFAVAMEEGLIVPAINHCQNKSLPEVAKASSDLIERAQRGTLRVEEYTGSTFSISNMGMFDVDSFGRHYLTAQCGGAGGSYSEGAAGGAGWTGRHRPGNESDHLGGPPGGRRGRGCPVPHGAEAIPGTPGKLAALIAYSGCNLLRYRVPAC